MPSWNVHFDLTLRVNDRQIVEDLAKIDALASVIRGIPIPPSTQQRLDRLNILRAARGTIGIEGTELSEAEMDRVMESTAELPVLGQGREREEQEARNAEALMRYVAESVQQNPGELLSEPLILQFHRILTQGIRYPHNEPGSYRNHAVTVGNYRPPPTGEEVRELMSGFVHWFNRGQAVTWPPVLRAIAAHFYLVSIHPFGDGNGRTSRAVESFLLYKAGINVRGYYSLANYYYQNRQDYFDHLNRVQVRGETDLTPFIAFALRGLVQELEAVHAEVLEEVKVIAFRDYAREHLDSVGKLRTPAGERQLRFLIELCDGPVQLQDLRSGRHMLAHLYRRLSPRTLMRDIDYLKEQDLIAVTPAGELRARVELMSQFTA